MTDPFKIPLPASVSFSGGRTSGYMLWRILQSYGGALPDDLKVTFANTGKEREETLEFVEECSQQWGVDIIWLEYCRDYSKAVVKSATRIGCHSFKRVDFKSANRDGTPFKDLVQVKSEFRSEAKSMPPVLPNPVQRFCSGELKARTMSRYLKSIGFEGYFQVVGLRACEPGRVSDLKRQSTQDCEFICPLHEGGVKEPEVLEFWKNAPFDLKLRNDAELGTYEGNCDMCFLKRAAKIKLLAREHPEAVAWWSDMETEYGQTFRRDRFSYTDLAAGRVPLEILPGEAAMPDAAVCLCTD